MEYTIKYVSWQADLIYDEALYQNKVIYHETLSSLYNTLNISNKFHIKEVCEVIRAHVNSYMGARYNSETYGPILTDTHKNPCKKITRKIICLNNNKIFKNCSKAANEYGINSNQILLCCKGKLKSVYIKNKETNEKERFRFAFIDSENKPLLTITHQEPLSQRKGISKIFLVYENPEIIKRIGTNKFSSLAEYCRKTGVPVGRARRYLKDKSINLLGLEFITVG